jgi:putative ABC transport system permease protein
MTEARRCRWRTACALSSPSRRRSPLFSASEPKSSPFRKPQKDSRPTGNKADSTHFILNETAIKEIGLKDPVGKRFRLWETEGTIIGVVKDFHFNTMREKIAPAAGGQFKQYNGEYPFTYHFLDDLFNSLYQGEQREGTLLNCFAGMAIFISCLGLL